MRARTKNPRYRTEVFQADSLQQNTIGDNGIRSVKIYLPPGYFSPSNKSTRYSTLYLLHGYGMSLENPLLTSKADLKQNIPLKTRIMFKKVYHIIPTYDMLDKLISSGHLVPTIIIQPDCTIPISNYYKMRGMTGSIYLKGCCFLNSTRTGNYEDYIFHDLIHFIDSNFRTQPSKSHRALIGYSMGGYGALLGGLNYPNLFNTIIGFSPLISWKDLLDVTPISPLYIKMLGAKKASSEAHKEMIDMFDTLDICLNPERKLIQNEEIQKNSTINWNNIDIDSLTRNNPNAFHQVNLFLSCEENDEYQFSQQIRKYEEILKERGIAYEIDIFTNKYAQKYSSHGFAINFKLLEGIQYCLSHMG